LSFNLLLKLRFSLVRVLNARLQEDDVAAHLSFVERNCRSALPPQFGFEVPQSGPQHCVLICRSFHRLTKIIKHRGTEKCQSPFGLKVTNALLKFILLFDEFRN
jgi:hypothetical protein